MTRLLAPRLIIDRGALIQNWQALNAKCQGRAGAVVKADGYGLGMEAIAPKLYEAGARHFFVATPKEAAALYALVPEARIYDLSGLSAFEDSPIIPVCQSWEQIPQNPRNFALQFDTGMTRLGFPMSDLPALIGLKPVLVMSHLASADEPHSPQNPKQLQNFRDIAQSFPQAQHSLANTGGIILGSEYHFDITRPGIGIYGAFPYREALPTVQIQLPILRSYTIQAGTQIGYNAQFTAKAPMKTATCLGGYADGLMRAFALNVSLFHKDTACPLLGRVSMDSLVADITHLDEEPEYLNLIHQTQNIDQIAEKSSTIAYELFTRLGMRYERIYR